MIFVYILIGLVLGTLGGYMYRESKAGKKVGSAEAKADKILEDAKK